MSSYPIRKLHLRSSMLLLPLMINSAYVKYIFLHILESRCELQLLSLCKCLLYSYHKDSTAFLYQMQGVL